MKSIFFVIAVFTFANSYASEMQVGSATITISAPPETNELCAEDQQVRNEVQKSVFGTHSLLTCFMNKEKWSKNTQDYVYLATIDKRAVNQNFNEAQFQPIKNSFDTGMVQYAKTVKEIKANPNNPERLKQVQHINDLTVDHFERFHSTNRMALLIHREKMDMKINGRHILTNAIVASGMLLANKKIFNIKMSKYLAGKKDFTDDDYKDVKQRFTEWANTITGQNKI